MFYRCHDYYPTKDYPSRQFNSFDVVLKEEQYFDHYVIRSLELLHKNKDISSEDDRCSHSRSLKHFQFTSWPDFGIFLIHSLK